MDILCSSVPSLIVGRPKASSAAYAVVTAIGYQHPYTFDDLAEQAQVIQGSGTTQFNKDQIVKALNDSGVKYIDEQSLVESGNTSNDYTDLRHELAALGRNEYIVLISIKNDKTLSLANADGTQGQTLHAWSSGVPYTLVRCGFSDSAAYGYYQDALLSSLPLPKYIPILWSDITACGIDSVLAIAPSSLAELPPSDFRYFGGLASDGSLLPDNTWPKEIAQFDPQPAIDAINALEAALKQERDQHKAALSTFVSTVSTASTALANDSSESNTQTDARLLDLLKQLGANTDTAQPTSSTSQPVPSSTPDTTQPTSTDVIAVTSNALTTQPLGQGVL